MEENKRDFSSITEEVVARGEEKLGAFDYAKSRYAICSMCEHLINPIKVCNQCYCFMPGKVLIKTASCPTNRWMNLE